MPRQGQEDSSVCNIAESKGVDMRSPAHSNRASSLTGQTQTQGAKTRHFQGWWGLSGCRQWIFT